MAATPTRRTRKKTKATAGISDDAVQAKTGRTWPEWLEVLDQAGGKTMTHKAIVAHLKTHFDISPWWQQMVTVGYEQARGLRAKHELPDGFQISKSKTIKAPIDNVYRAWKDARRRKRWLDESIRVRKANENKSLRVTWSDEKSHLDVYLTAKGESKTQVTVNHSKLASAKEAEHMKAMWAERLSALQTILES